MGKMRDAEFDDIEPRERRRLENRDRRCESCGEKNGKKRFNHGLEQGLLCDTCWQDLLDEQ